MTGSIPDLADSLAPGPDDPQPVFGGLTYNQALEIDRLSGVNGIDAALSQFNLGVVVSATDNPAWATDLLYGDHFIYTTSSLAAGAGYPIVRVPADTVFGVPFGVSFFGTAFSKPVLITLASGFEAFTQAREEPAELRADRARRQHRRHDADAADKASRRYGADRQCHEGAAPLVIAVAAHDLLDPVGDLNVTTQMLERIARTGISITRT